MTREIPEPPVVLAYKSIRFLALRSVVFPLIFTLPVALILGRVLLVIVPTVLGVLAAVVWLAAWFVFRDRLERAGFRW